MKFCGVVLALACMVSASALTPAETPKAVRVPAGDLADGLDSLAKQYGVDVIYPSALVKGRKTRGVNGTLSSAEAFSKLLEGNTLAFSEEGGAVLIMQAEIAPLLATVPPVADDSIDEVEVEGKRVKLSAMRAELEKLEEQFYAEYNKVNTVRQYDVFCGLRLVTGSRVPRRFCRPAFLEHLREERDTPTFEQAAPNAYLTLRRTQDYQKNMVEVVARHPDLFVLVKDYNALVLRYQQMRGEARKR